MKRIILFIITLSFILVAVAKDSYYPTYVVDREYIYTNGNDTIKINTRPSAERDGYVVFNADNREAAPWLTALKEEGTHILRDNIGNGPLISDEMLNFVKEYITTVDSDFVHFDYNLQVGDTLCVVNFMTSAPNGTANFLIVGNIIKILSIDTILLQSENRIKYNLESRYMMSTLWKKLKEPDNQPPFDYECRYEVNYVGTPYHNEWIEGIGYTTYGLEEWDDLIYTLQCVFEKGELIYCAEGAKCDGLSDNANEKIDFATLTLHREGDHVIAVFPAVGVGEAVTLYDTTGRVVASQPLRQGATTATIDIAYLPQGVYIARVGNTLSAKVVL